MIIWHKFLKSIIGRARTQKPPCGCAGALIDRALDDVSSWNHWVFNTIACGRARGSWFQPRVVCVVRSVRSASQHNLLIPCYHWIVDHSVQLYQLSLPLLSLALYHLLLGYCYPLWYIGDSYNSLKIEIYRTSP